MACRLASLTVLLPVALLACGPSDRQQAVDLQEIQQYLESYLPLLGSAYSTGDLEPLEDVVAIKEVARVEKRIHDLRLQGRILAPTFRQLTIEDVNVFNFANAYVTTLEVWDVRVLATGSDTVLAEEIGQRNRVQYQLKRERGSWRVLFRSIQR
jgi:hypothetical protein